MPAVQSRVHHNDPPWITPEFKTLIAKRQQAFMSADMDSYRHLRNAVNRERTASGSDCLRSALHVEGLDHHLPDRDVAHAINSAFLDHMMTFWPLAATPSFESSLAVLTLSEVDVLSALSKLNPRKAAGPDGIPSRVLKEYADIIAQPVTSILNSSFAEQQLPPSWKQADVVPIPNQVIDKHLRLISLTSIISKLAEDFVVSALVGPAVLKIIDPDQFGAIPRSSTLQALTSMLHHWTRATDGTGSAVRVVLSV